MTIGRKNYRVHFSLFNMNRKSHAVVEAWRTQLKAFMVTIGGATFFTTNSDYALIVAGLAFLGDSVLQCLWVEEV